jgi:phospholipid-binding lipoprotein MlaA
VRLPLFPRRGALCRTLSLAFALGLAIARLSTGAEVPEQPEDSVATDYDPWQPFNERMFVFDHDVLDGYVMKPAAKGWRFVTTDFVRRSLDRAFNNIAMPKRFVNCLLQGRLVGASRELARFTINTTVGVAGLFDVAGDQLHLDPVNADTGQTLGVYGIGPGPYLVLPALPPLTVRDGIGYGIDGVLDPLGRFTPLVAAVTLSVVQRVNERSLNLDWFRDVEESALDLYSAVRNAYLQRRRRSIEDAITARKKEWHCHTTP